VIPTPEISVIILNWNGKPFLEDCLSAMRRQTFWDFETILVDNGSNDGSVEYVRSQFPEIKLLALPENLGFTGENIVGYAQASGDLVVLLNNDTEAHPNWLEEIHKASHSYSDAGSFASKIMYFDERGRMENCGFDLETGGAAADLGRDEPAAIPPE
jgi:GT2 family glycosyltransferase